MLPLQVVKLSEILLKKDTHFKKDGERKHKKQPWTEEEMIVVKSTFWKEMTLNSILGEASIEHVLKKYHSLQGHKWTNVKYFIWNHFRRAISRLTETCDLIQ